MSVDMTKWCELAKQRIHTRPAGTGRLAGKIAVVTGAAQGFGKGIAEEMYKEGASIVIADLNAPLAESVAKELGARAISIAVNVADEESVAALMAQTVETLGGLDILVSNAGVVRSGPLSQMERRDFDFVTDINYTGYFLCAKYAAIIMEAQHEADPDAMFDIIELNSKSGLEGSNKNCAYAGSKFGGIGLTQSLALEFAEENIRVNSICPGNLLDSPLWVNSLYEQYARNQGTTKEKIREKYINQVPMKRGCQYDDVANLMVFLLSDESSYMTGQGINVTGGQQMV